MVLGDLSLGFLAFGDPCLVRRSVFVSTISILPVSPFLGLRMEPCFPVAPSTRGRAAKALTQEGGGRQLTTQLLQMGLEEWIFKVLRSS